jgi:hypothetical protein
MIVSTKILNFGRPGRLKTGSGDFLVDSDGNHLCLLGGTVKIATVGMADDRLVTDSGDRIVTSDGDRILILGNSTPCILATQE